MESLEQFFKDNDRGYPRDPRRMAYAKLRKNTQGMDREQLEAFINANLFIPHSQYKMALGNLIKFLQKQDQMSKLNEIKQFQKIAGIVTEGYMGTPYDSSEDMAVDMVNKGIKEDDYSEDPSSDMDDESQSGDTDAMGIDEAGNVKGIKIEIPGNSHAGDFGKAAAREVVESFGPREYRTFLEAFLNEFKKITGGV
jgi:hypothetical protein